MSKPSDIAPPLLRWFEHYGRAGLPWRTERSPYRTVVSEFMLQQTQVERVIPVFERFVARWPGFVELARAPRADVVRDWRGLGYNSRAVRLQGLAQTVVERHGGVLPRSESALRELPGVGAYTARAIAAFGFDADVAAIDTNVRRIVHRTQLGVEWPPLAKPAQLDALATQMVPEGSGYAFNSAMMDLGAGVCTARNPKCLLCPLREACAAAPLEAADLARLAERHAPSRGPQARMRFEETTRYVRGRVVDRLRELRADEAISLLDLHATFAAAGQSVERERFDAALGALVAEGIVEVNGERVRLAQ